MPVYQVTTPTKLRVIKATGQKDAIEYACHDDYKATVLSAVKLADLIADGFAIEVTDKAGKTGQADDGQIDIETALSQVDDALKG